MLKQGEWNNCVKCNSSYTTYNLDNNSEWKEEWCENPCFEDDEVKQPKGLCQFCNPKTKYYVKDFKTKTTGAI